MAIAATNISKLRFKFRFWRRGGHSVSIFDRVVGISILDHSSNLSFLRIKPFSGRKVESGQANNRIKKTDMTIIIATNFVWEQLINAHSESFQYPKRTSTNEIVWIRLRTLQQLGSGNTSNQFFKTAIQISLLVKGWSFCFTFWPRGGHFYSRPQLKLVISKNQASFWPIFNQDITDFSDLLFRAETRPSEPEVRCTRSGRGFFLIFIIEVFKKCRAKTLQKTHSPHAVKSFRKFQWQEPNRAKLSNCEFRELTSLCLLYVFLQSSWSCLKKPQNRKLRSRKEMISSKKEVSFAAHEN